MNSIVEAAMKVSMFVKNNDYPEKHSPEFGELTMLLNNQEIALKKAGFLK